MLRKPRTLVIPFKFREGYPDELVNPLIESAINVIEETGIECVRAATVVNDAEADAVSREYSSSSYDFCILLIPTWFEPITLVRAVKNLMKLPTVIWGFSNFIYNGERVNLGSSAGAGVAKGTLKELGVIHEYIYFSPGIGKDDWIKERLWKIANVSRAISLMEESRMITIGYQFGGMTLGDIDLTKMRSLFGVDLIEIDNYTLIRRMECLDIDSPEYKSAETEVLDLTKGTIGNKLQRVSRMYTVLRQMLDENNAQAITLKCHFVLSQEYGLTACIPLSVLGNHVVASCEADIPLTLTQMLLYYLSDGKLTTYADTHELMEHKVLLGACGFAPAGMCIDNKIICELPPENPSGLGATFKDYITNKNHLKEGRMTIARILKNPDCGFTIHSAVGNALGDIGKTSEFGAPQYSFTELQLDGSVERFAQNLGSHHYALVYADLLQELQLYCHFKGIGCLTD